MPKQKSIKKAAELGFGAIKPADEMFEDVPADVTAETEEEEEAEASTALIPADIVPDKLDVGDTVTFRVVAVHDDEYELAWEGGGEEEEPEETEELEESEETGELEEPEETEELRSLRKPRKPNR